MVSTSVIMGYQNGAPVSYFVPGPTWPGAPVIPMIKKISPGLKAALSAYSGPGAGALLYWTPYSNELRGVYSAYGNSDISTTFRPYSDSALISYVIQTEHELILPKFTYDDFEKSPRDPLAMALSAMGLGSQGLGSQGSSYSDLAESISDGFSLAKKLAPLAGKVGIRAVPYLGWASTILDVLSSLLDLLDAANIPNEEPPNDEPPGSVEVYCVPGEELPSLMTFPPSHVTGEAIARDVPGTFESVTETVTHIYNRFMSEYWLYLKYQPNNPFFKLDWEELHMERVLDIVRYFRKYFFQFGQFLELEFDFSTWLNADPSYFDEFADFFQFLYDYCRNLIHISYRAYAEDSTIFKVITECCSPVINLPESNLVFPNSLSLSIPDLTSYLSGRTHEDLEEAITNAGGCVFPYSIMYGNVVSPLF